MSTSIFDIVRQMDEAEVDNLYGKSVDGNGRSDQSHFACKAVFQSLGTLSKTLVMRLIFLDRYSINAFDMFHFHD